MDLLWEIKDFNKLNSQELYDIMKLRNDVFVVEQNCVYQDADGKDPVAQHLQGRSEGELVAYARILGPGLAFKEPSIGRVVTSPKVRRSGTGKELMNRSIDEIRTRFGSTPIRIGAQRYLEKFYADLGFKIAGEPYMEDGIPHIEMLLTE